MYEKKTGEDPPAGFNRSLFEDRSRSPVPRAVELISAKMQAPCGKAFFHTSQKKKATYSYTYIY